MPNYEFQAPLTLERLFQMLSTHPDFSNPNVALDVATITLTPERHADRNLLIDRAAGVTVTLPKATGSGVKYKFYVKTVATSNSHIIKVGNTTDVFKGTVSIVDTDTAGTTTAFATAADSDTITLNRSTTGSVTVGEWVEIVDIASGIYAVTGVLSNTAAGATPFSAGV